MANVQGFPWHIEYFHKTNEFKRTCFNCKFYNDYTCYAKNEYISNNNATYCKEYKNRYHTEEEILKRKKKRIKEKKEDIYLKHAEENGGVVMHTRIGKKTVTTIAYPPKRVREKYKNRYHIKEEIVNKNNKSKKEFNVKSSNIIVNMDKKVIKYGDTIYYYLFPSKTKLLKISPNDVNYKEMIKLFNGKSKNAIVIETNKNGNIKKYCIDKFEKEEYVEKNNVANTKGNNGSSYKKDYLEWLRKLDLVGENIIHKVFGEGKIIDFNGTNISVEFLNGEIKKFNYPEKEFNQFYLFKNELYNNWLKKYYLIDKK